MSQWIVNTAARAALGLAMIAAPAAHAVVVYSGPLNLAIPNNTTGLYVNVIDGTTFSGPGTFPTLPGPGANFDFNFFGSATTWSAFSPTSSGQTAPSVPTTSRGYVSASPTGALVSLALGTPIDGSSIFNTGSPSATALANGSTLLVGFRFRSENDLASAADDTVHFGWARISLPLGSAGTLLDYAYESTPLTALQAGVVPEPASVALMALGALGVLGVTARRRRQAATA